MQAAPATSMGTVQPHTSGGFPPFKTESFPSQFFWLVICFAVLFVVLWRIAGPRIGAAIQARKDRIDGDLAAAAQHKEDAEAALGAYSSALAEAKANAAKLAEQNRQAMNAEVEKAKAAAEAEAKAATTEAEKRISALRTQAGHDIDAAAVSAAAEIVSRLIGETVTTDEAADAVKAVRS